jgi:hypothetical protein
MKASLTDALRRVPFVISGLLLSLYVVNMVARIAHIKFHADVWSVGDVGEFLLVLLCMVFFVAGLLALEASESPVDVVNEPTQGGVQ